MENTINKNLYRIKEDAINTILSEVTKKKVRMKQLLHQMNENNLSKGTRILYEREWIELRGIVRGMELSAKILEDSL